MGTRVAQLRWFLRPKETSMAPRPYWKGYLKLSLVSCPVALYPASTQAEKTHFHQINTKTGHRLRQQMVDEETGRVVESDQKGRGYELSKGRYVPIDDDELKGVQLESTHTIDIDSFVPKDEIDERYIEKPYYLVPNDETGEDAFSVIRDAMQEKGRVALARIVLAHREHILAIQPYEKGMLAVTLRYPYELREPQSYFHGIPKKRMPKDMVSLAEHILESKAGHFDPSRFKDQYETALKKLVQRKAKGKTIEPPEEQEEPSNIINLMDALRQSVGKHKRKTKKKSGAGKRKKAVSRRRKAA
jgi:DNA end-binding protein Ku